VATIEDTVYTALSEATSSLKESLDAMDLNDLGTLNWGVVADNIASVRGKLELIAQQCRDVEGALA
jgi:hypothetical protein